MNTNNIKRYAPKARTAFIAAMTKRAALFGIRESSIPSTGIEPLEQKGDLALIGNRPFPASIIRPRAALVKKVEQMGFAQAMEQAAYSWFNRLCAIRYMELKGYLEHGRRVLSHPDQPGSFQILDDCLDIELEGLDKKRIAELKLDGTKDEELYRELLLAQCHALHKAMPFLFEAVDDATELLLPDNLTKTDSLIRELVSAIPDEDWQDVEIIGWLYQFYISEKKDQVIGKVVKSEDIPAATQLFTPNWIVQYLVQNSVGRQWLQTYPDSPLKAKMPYYIEPAEQTPEVQAQLAAITPDSIDPLSIKVLDPACGSGHILVEAYKVLKAIYEERGHRSRDIPQLIFENNLFGLDIDDRAGQLAGFALMMLAREDDRRVFSREVKLNVLSLQESRHLDFAGLWKALNLTSDWQHGQSQSLFDSEQSDLSTAQADNRYQLLKTTLEHFTQAKTFGSLIEIPAENAEPLGELLEQLRKLAKHGDVMQKPAAEQLIPFVQQAWVLAQRYDAVVANPPYMGSKGMNSDLKAFAGKQFPNSKSDLFAIFMERAFGLVNVFGHNAQVNMQSWMFLSSYENLREWLLNTKTFITMAHLGARAFGQISGEVVQTTAWILSKKHVDNYYPAFFRLTDGNEEDKRATIITRKNRYDKLKQGDFKKIPGGPIAYWLSPLIMQCFYRNKKTKSMCHSFQGIITGDNNQFLRYWFEVKKDAISWEHASYKDAEGIRSWVPYSKGGNYRKWYGNNEHVLKWNGYGDDLTRGRTENRGYFFREGLTWSDIAASKPAFRLLPASLLYDAKSPSAFYADNQHIHAIGLMNSKFVEAIAPALNPTLSFQIEEFYKIPVTESAIKDGVIAEAVKSCISTSKQDWDSYENSWEFKANPLLAVHPHTVAELSGAKSSDKLNDSSSALADIYKEFRLKHNEIISQMQRIEQENNRHFIDSYGLYGELEDDVPLEQITLTINSKYRYGSDLPEDILESRFQSDTLAELVSYVISCIMGRYSLDREGLVYAHAGNQGFAELVAEGAYKTFPADSDGILPLTDQEWFADDATNRFREFVRTVWGDEHLQENLDFVAESLCLYAIKPLKGKSGGESAQDTIRRYLSTQFYKDHLKTYKRRPIYWQFSSGKHKAFECLVYLHRYNEGTLARMRTEYVIPLTAKLNTYASKLATDIENETVTPEKKRLEKELATLHNQQAELATFDEKLRHHADQRISLDLDEGVKVNYGKFGDLLAEVKAVTGDKGD
ncbi:BREX-1 system adenine-specific DNA-methyltransferase PglX [Pseudomonas extremaustralis]|uniref:BREX-1 system adenine-specific DNA-methyltransferase PglX n=1 Tax=Pseudomonas extremaustralis TaxID=359110 RepID=UPI00240F260E|nr:BREX-1 system adenine-specific DNA-methyltransferase PglX [Pseudomonas extremaustralis]MDG2965977.1 BREX-1 system adenine-specific DNA-methyltransferase PglX [Pseudomonas extremaustralis]